MTKRELYKEMFPDREAKNSNKHYSRFTLPELLKVKAQWAERDKHEQN